ncbi:MAG: GatB/YqeY domain-containing protein [Pseudomonadota bacterium]
MREMINAAMKDAMRAKESERLATIRLVNAAIKDRDIAARTDGNADGVGDSEILGILGKMVKQRQESAKVYEEAGRLELADSERAEIKVIEEFLPKQLSDDEVAAAVKDAIAETGAESIRDMGKVMAVLKSKYAGQMDFGAAGGAVKKQLG